jgi:hypothetical protein
MSAKAVTALCNDACAPVKVHIVPGLLEKIAELALEGYAATSHGGLEIGGLLFGSRDTDVVTVENFRPLACDHSLGPRFILSDRDKRSLHALLCAPASDPALQGLCAIGWFCSHTRSDLVLLDRELVLHNTYFPGADDLVIIFKPRDLRSVTAGIFLRGVDGAPDPHRPATTLELPELDITRPRSQTPAKNGRDLSAFSCHSAPPSANERASMEFIGAAQSTTEPTALTLDPSTKTQNHSWRPAKWKMLLAAAAVIALLCLGVWRYSQVTQATPANLFLSLRPHADKLLLSWKTNLVKPRRAHVDIVDGTSNEHVNITDIFQSSGVLLFPHNTRNVQAVLTIETGNSIVVRHAFFDDPAPAIRQSVPFEKPPENGPPPINQANQQLASKTTSKHSRRRHSRRTRHKATTTSPAALQPGQKLSAGQH